LFETYSPELSQLYQESTLNGKRPNRSQWRITLIAIAKTASPNFIIFNALDDELNEILDDVIVLSTSVKSVKLYATSHPHVGQVYRPLHHHRLSNVSIEIVTDPFEVEKCIKKTGKQSSCVGDFKAMTLESMTAKADGMYLLL